MHPSIIYLESSIFLTLSLSVQHCRCLINHHDVKTLEPLETKVHVSLTSTLDVRQWSASLSSSFIPGEESPIFHCKGGWKGLRAGLEDF
jgi:hypothetical protein